MANIIVKNADLKKLLWYAVEKKDGELIKIIKKEINERIKFDE